MQTESFDTITECQQMASSLLTPRCDLVESTLHTITTKSETCCEGQKYAETCACREGMEKQTPNQNLTCPREINRSLNHVAYVALEENPPIQARTYNVRNSELFDNSSGDLDFTQMRPTVCQAAEGLLASTLVDGTNQWRQSQDILGGLCGCPTTSEGFYPMMITFQTRTTCCAPFNPTSVYFSRVQSST